MGAQIEAKPGEIKHSGFQTSVVASVLSAEGAASRDLTRGGPTDNIRAMLIAGSPLQLSGVGLFLAFGAHWRPARNNALGLLGSVLIFAGSVIQLWFVAPR